MNYGGNLSHRFVNRVRSTNKPMSGGTTGGTGTGMHEKDLPRHYTNDDEADIGEATSPRGEFEPATALHGCKICMN